MRRDRVDVRSRTGDAAKPSSVLDAVTALAARRTSALAFAIAMGKHSGVPHF